MQTASQRDIEKQSSPEMEEKLREIIQPKFESSEVAGVSAKEPSASGSTQKPSQPAFSTSHKPRNIFEDIMMDEAFHEERLRIQREIRKNKKKMQQKLNNEAK